MSYPSYKRCKYLLIILLHLTSSRGLHPRLGGTASEDVGEYASPPAGGSATLPSKNPASWRGSYHSMNNCHFQTRKISPKAF